MAYDNSTTVAGNCTGEVEMRFTPSGKAVCNFSMAVNEGKDKASSFFDVQCWDKLAENVVESVNKGDRVIVFGRLTQRTWETQEGAKRSKVEIVADDVALSLKWNTGRANRPERQDGEAHHASQQPTRGYGQARDLDEEPF